MMASYEDKIISIRGNMKSQLKKLSEEYENNLHKTLKKCQEEQVTIEQVIKEKDTEIAVA